MSDLKVKICKSSKDSTDLQSLTKEELIQRIVQLEAHVVQLKNLLKTDSNQKANELKTSKPFDHKKYAKRHVLLHVAYTGWDYVGFVIQEQTQKTIEAELFKALEKTRLIENRESSNYHRCGRTDKGVSSFGQVISIDLRSTLESGPGVFIPEGHEIKPSRGVEIRYAHTLNKVLPKDIRVIAWAPVPEAFSARFDCQQRKYHYYFPKGNLDIEKMRIAADYLVGQHDFRNFCKMDVGNGVVQFLRNMISVQIDALDHDAKDSYAMYRITLIGQAFLWHQVRCIVAILFLIGRGKENPSIIQELLDIDKNPRKPQYAIASELPLNLFQCSYSDVNNWVYDQEALQYVMTDYQTMWTEHCVKTTMLREMLDQVQSVTDTKVEKQNHCLIQGIEPKEYTPLMKRPKCDSLEQRIQHYAKRKRIEIVTDSENV